MIVKYKIVKEGQKGLYYLIRADGSSKRYSSMIRMLQGIDREDLETLWKLVKEKHGINKPVDEYERPIRVSLVYEEMARNLEAQLQAELIEEERLARQKEEEANIALIESWDNTQAMIEANFELAQRL
ncbi:hypothetical protein Tco_1462498 [Tanacetum coccineum]